MKILTKIMVVSVGPSPTEKWVELAPEGSAGAREGLRLGKEGA